mmetsp:Transcript_110306/g.237426  ORF Transcript_110306/g.237426 Transcript_110306/m.237426 type:complete len:105 (+) Transcript_110306:210-524(+)
MGFIFIFSMSFELTALVCLFTNLLEIRVDTFKICHTWKRGNCRKDKSVGIWNEVAVYCSTSSIIVNLTIIFLEINSLDHFKGIDFADLFVMFMLIENLCLYLKY